MKYQGNIQRGSMITKFDGLSSVAAFRKNDFPFIINYLANTSKDPKTKRVFEMT